MGIQEEAPGLITSTCSLSTLSHTSIALAATNRPLNCLAPPGVRGQGHGGRRENSLLLSKRTLFFQGGRKTGSTITQGSYTIY